MNRILDQNHSELDTLWKAAFERLDVFWARLALHIRAENVQLFSALLRAAETAPRHGHAPPHDEIVDTVERLRANHDFFMSELTAAMKELRELRLEETRVYRWSNSRNLDRGRKGKDYEQRS